MSLPYENATSGSNALAEAERILRKFGCANFGTMTDWERGVLICQFAWKDRRIHIEASWRGYAELWLKEHHYNPRHHRKSRQAYEAVAKMRGEIAVPSILRDWIKGQVTAIILFGFNIIGYGLGPTVTALFTDYVYRDEAQVGYALATCYAILGPIAFLIMLSGLKPYGRAVAAVREHWHKGY